MEVSLLHRLDLVPYRLDCSKLLFIQSYLLLSNEFKIPCDKESGLLVCTNQRLFQI